MTSTERSGGFTLLEMLVVLLIAGVALALTSQALGQYQRAHTRAVASERTGREHRLAEGWLRASIRGLQPTGRVDINGRLLSRDEDPFKGDARGFTGMTLAPVLATPGGPTRQDWTIATSRTGVHLQLHEGDATFELALPRARELTLGYMDETGELHTEWPPPLGEWPELPAAVVLEFTPGPGDPAAVIVQSVAGPQDPVFRQFEFQHE